MVGPKIFQGRGNQQLAALGHRIARIHGQIQQHLFNHAGVGGNGRNLRVVFGTQHDIFAQNPLKHLRHVSDDLVQIQRDDLQGRVCG